MPRKPTTPAAPVDSDGFLCIPSPLLWKWRAHVAELNAATLDLEKTQASIQHEIEKNTVLKDLLQHKTSLVGVASGAKAEVVAVQAQIEETMGVSLKDCSFDEKTGRLYNLEVDRTPGAPKKPTKKPRKKR